MGIKAIVFDFGNVVSRFDHWLTTDRLASYTRLGRDAIHAYLFGGPLEDDYDCGRISTEAFLCQVRDRLGLTCSDEVVARAWADIFQPDPDVAALLPRLGRHYRLLLASNTNELHSQQFIRQFADTLRHFDGIVLSHAIGVRKPNSAFFEHCRRQAGCAAAECLFIDDLPANVAGARACGWHGIVYTGAAALEEQFLRLGIQETGP